MSSTSAGILLNVSTGSVFVAVGTAPGAQTLTYRICEIASPSNCDTADVTITVNPFPIDAVNDTGAAPRTGGTALGNVLANDTFAGAIATLAKVRLSQLASTHAGISLNVGQRRRDRGRRDAGRDLHAPLPHLRDRDPVQLRRGDRHGDGPASADHGGNDYASGSSKVANTVLASVLTNDRLGNAPATPATVRLVVRVAHARQQQDPARCRGRIG